MDQPVKLASLAEIELWSMAYAAALGGFITTETEGAEAASAARADLAVMALRERCVAPTEP